MSTAHAETMRFVFVQPHLRFGGAETQTVLVANELVARGHEVRIVLHRAEGMLVSRIDPRIEVHALGTTSHLATVLLAVRMRSVLRRLPPSIVVVKLWSAILVCGLATRGLRHTVVFTEDLDPSDHARFIRFGKLKQVLVGFVFRSARHLVANTHAVARVMVDVYGLRVRPRVIHPTAPIMLLRAIGDGVPHRAAPLDLTPLRVASVGSLVGRKGHDLTLTALVALQRPVEWHLVGEGPLLGSLRRAAETSSSVVLIEHGPLLDPAEVVARCDVLVHSARSEAFGLVLLESLALGVPVVAAAGSGPREIAAALGEAAGLTLTPLEDPAATARALSDPMTYRRPDASALRAFDLHTACDSWVAIARESPTRIR